MLKTILLGAVLLIAAVLLYATTRPDSFQVQRTVTITASPDRIYELIDDFHHWTAWSPWEKMDPMMQRKYSGTAHGTGAIYEWEGNSKVGKGRMEITQAVPPHRIVIKLDFLTPFEAHNTAEFTLADKGGTTSVTWSMTGRNPYFAKLMQIFFSMDSMVGRDFETGLANLKARAES
jgi:uncharacterized protein YndB with AHSA1/START domain